MTWIDHHCHLPPDTARASEWVERARERGVDTIIDVGCDLASSRAAIGAAAYHPGVWATVGVHPHDAAGGIEGVEELVGADRVVAVGECGLDYHYMRSPAAAQRDAFAQQIQIATRHRLPLVVHSRAAWDDTFDVLESEGIPERLVFHCFTGGLDEAKRCLRAGALLSFSGIVTFPSAAELKEVARMCPADRLLVETDSPYLAPVPYRGRPNEPGNVAVVGEAVAEIRGVTAAEMAELTATTARAFYSLGESPGVR